MFLLIFALVSLARAGKFPCEEPVKNYRLPSTCPLGQVPHKNVCRSYFQLRSEGKTCLLSEYPLLTQHLPTNEVICPVRAQTSDCSLYRAQTSDCLDTPTLKLPLCKEYDAQGEYNRRKMCAQLTAWIPLKGIIVRGPSRPGQVLPAVVPSGSGGQCPAGYCPTNSGFCIRSGKTNAAGYGGMAGIFHPVDRPTEFFHGQPEDVSSPANFRDIFQNTQTVPGVRGRRSLKTFPEIKN